MTLPGIGVREIFPCLPKGRQIKSAEVIFPLALALIMETEQAKHFNPPLGYLPQ
jgi:hypothetical protein